MNRRKAEIRVGRIARAIGLGRTTNHGWRRRDPLPNRGHVTADALRAAQEKRDRRKVRNLEQRMRGGYR